MAQVYRPHYFVDPITGKRVKSSFPGAVRKKSLTWHIRYWLNGRRLRVKGYTDKQATKAKAAEIERRAMRQAEGLVDPTDEHAKIPLDEHLADYIRYLTDKGNTGKHVSLSATRIQSCLDGCHFVKIADVQTSAVLAFLADLRTAGKSLKTANEYLAATKGFMRWLWRDKRTAVDPLAGLPRLASKGAVDIRHARRDLDPDELRRLLEATRQSPTPRRRLSGNDRYFLYLTACATGFRASELASLTPESFDLTFDAPTVTVSSSCAKNRREAVQPLPADVAEALREFLHGKPAGKPVWPGKWSSRGFLMIRADLREARRIWLAEAQDATERVEMERMDFLTYCDSQGRYADFHALRHSYITAIGKTGRLSQGASRAGPAFDLCSDRSIYPCPPSRPGRHGFRHVSLGSGRTSIPGRHGHGREARKWAKFPWPKP